MRGGAQGHDIVSRSQNQELPGRNWNHKLGGYAGSEAIELDKIKEVLVMIERLPRASSGKVSLCSSSQYLSGAS